MNKLNSERKGRNESQTLPGTERPHSAAHQKAFSCKEERHINSSLNLILPLIIQGTIILFLYR